jgi:hypothetical protein
MRNGSKATPQGIAIISKALKRHKKKENAQTQYTINTCLSLL